MDFQKYLIPFFIIIILSLVCSFQENYRLDNYVDEASGSTHDSQVAYSSYLSTIDDGSNFINDHLIKQSTDHQHVTTSAASVEITVDDNDFGAKGDGLTDDTEAFEKILITSSVIATGDDCISIVNGSQMVQAANITCGPGHGISIGSLGSGNSEVYVSEIGVKGAKLYGTTNGVRIKTWQGGSGSASNITFENIEMHNVTNPILIDQNYVQVNNVVYKNINGTSASDVAIKLDCSKSFPCERIVLQDIHLQNQGGKTAKALCNNISFITIGIVSPFCIYTTGQ